jgi:RNA polymerase sigma-70 factor (ECF subfamily)
MRPKKKSIKLDPDLAVVLQCQEGDLEAYNQLVVKYQRKVIQLCHNHIGQYEEACDLAQEVFVQVYHSLAKFEGRSSFSTWLYRVTLNACFNRQKYLAAKGRNKVGSLEGLLERDDIATDHSPLFNDQKPDALGLMQQKETVMAVRQALQKLSPEGQKVIEMIDLEGMTYEESATVLEIPVNTVRSRLSRAREALKKQLERLNLRP